MPYVDLVAHDDYASLWYTTNAPYSNVSGFDPARPTIILLHPLAFDSTWLSNQFSDPRLDQNYNMIAFDLRFAGKSETRPSPRLDFWVEAADLAFACQILQVPPAHIWAEEVISTNVALRFAILFPEMCLSLTLITVGPPTELQNYHAIFDEILYMWCFAQDLEDLEHAAGQFLEMTVGNDLDTEEIDKIIGYWETAFAPFRRVRLTGTGNLFMNRVPLTSVQLASINQPVLLLHGENNNIRPIKYAHNLKSDLLNATVSISILKGCAGHLSLIPTSASIVNQIFIKFISRLPQPSSDNFEPSLSEIPTRMAQALDKLASLSDKYTITTRDPMSSMSFSLVSPEVEKMQRDIFATFIKDQSKAFSPLGSDGRPVRKYSERHDGHWSNGDYKGVTYVGFGADSASIIPMPSRNASTGRLAPEPRSTRSPEPVTWETVLERGMRRAAFSTYTLEKQASKNPIAKSAALAKGAVGKVLA